MELRRELENLTSKDRVFADEPLSKHTTFQVGGPADFLVQPTEEELPGLVAFCKENEIPYTVIGNGSNLLVSDRGIRGVVIEIGTPMAAIDIVPLQEQGEYELRLQAGAMLIAVAKQAARESLTGLEFASGIPGNIGGALVMNAGAYGGEMKDVLESVTVLTPEGKIVTYDCTQYDGGYRSSRPMKNGDLILHATLRLKKGDAAAIQAKMDELRAKRQEKQPLEYPSAGSTFKRPEGYFAGKLIMDAGLAGYRVGGAQVSEKHCGFVINVGEATAADIWQLMQDVSLRVQEQFGVTLEPEVRLMGEF